MMFQMWRIFCHFVLICVGRSTTDLDWIIYTDQAHDLKATCRDDECLSQCLDSFTSSSKSVSPELNGWYRRKQNGSEVSLWPTAETFREYCVDVMLPFIACVDSCSNSNLKMWHQNLLSAEKLMCVEWFEELYKNYKCWQRADNASRNQCGCLKLYSDEEHFDKDDIQLYESCDYAGYKKSLDDHCQYITCRKSCETLITKEYCGQNLTDLIVNDLNGLAIRSIKIDFVMTNKYKSFWPYHCTQLLQETGYDTPTKVKYVVDVCENEGTVSKVFVFIIFAALFLMLLC